MAENKKEWKKVEDSIFKFEKIGDGVEGELLSIEQSSIHNNKVYKLKDSTGKVITVFGTAILDTRLHIIPLGTEIQIVFSGVKPSKTKGQNDLKLFDVYIR